MDGWIKLHRKLTESAVFQNPNLLKVWIWCLCKASCQPYQTLVGCQLVDVPVGAFIFGRKKAAEELGINERTLYDYMHLLENLQMISIKSNNKFSIVTIDNWEEYQLIDGDDYQQQTNNKSNNKFSLVTVDNCEENQLADGESNNKPTANPTTNQHKQEYIYKYINNISSNNKCIKQDIQGYKGLFEQFWEAYPKRKAKTEAEKAFKKHIVDKVDIEVVLAAIESHKKSEQWQRENGQYIPYPATWINQHRWEDEITEKPKGDDYYRNLEFYGVGNFL